MSTVLIVDDDPGLVESVSLVLQDAGYEVLCAYNGEEGYAAAQEHRPDAMVLDVMMTHDTEGFEMVRKLRSDPAMHELPVIMLTGIRKAKHLPFRFDPDPDWLPVKAVLEKPVNPEELLRHVGEAVKARKEAAEQ